MKQLWINFLVEFHTTRDYYLCHDYLEKLWVTLGKPKNNVYVGFLQLAVSMYHFRRKNYKGASIVLEKSQEKLSTNKDKVVKLGVDYEKLVNTITQLKQDLLLKKTFYDVNIPLINELELKCINESTTGKQWLSESNLDDLKLVNRHIHKKEK